MAEDIRDEYPKISLTESKRRRENLIKECLRQYDNCRYSSASLFIWKKYARVWRGAFLIFPIVLGGIASSQLLVKAGSEGKIIGAFCGLIAGMFPSISKSLNLDVHVESIQQAASEFTNLRDRFRRSATVTAFEDFEKFNAEVESLMDRLDSVRISAPPSPEWCFRRAQKKIGKGDYDFDVDAGIESSKK
ncbi:SLATT domain-containing protein [Asaia bogorensis]|uniref:SLATT domain-containing protein n=1 Tax=Asaia bogorensis TaxID=91915 RepID=UPI002861BDE3|nr:SLATT domain-containing protein [Asaia bogorensis]MDR6182952.1 hypothetical protein [Asaia bogorensis NBRC 16594]